jgi:hypothetical protein
MYEADAFISIPKLKTHAKVGATLNVKGLIGTIAEKNGLVHWRIGFPRFCGDEYPRPRYAVDYVKLAIQHFLADIIPERLLLFIRDWLRCSTAGRALQSFFQTEYQKSRMLRGAFPSNDTTWRTAVDVYNAFLDECGLHARRKAVRFLSVIDGVIGGDTDGPHFPNPVMSRVIITGSDLVATDLVASRLMDFNISYITYLVHLAGMKNREIKVVSEDMDTSVFFNPSTKHLLFRPPHGWERMSLHGVKPGKVYKTDRKMAKGTV